MHMHFTSAGQALTKQTAIELEYGLTEMSRRYGECLPQYCVRLVKEWLSAYGYSLVGPLSSTAVKIVSGREHADIHEKYLNEKHWNEVLKKHKCSRDFWQSLFQGTKYRESGSAVADLIPDDDVVRLVLHFLCDWPKKFKSFFDDEEVPVEQRVAVLRKQLENILYFGRERWKGSLWRMYSLPDEILKQALLGEGEEVPTRERSGNQMRTIQGRLVTASTDSGISRTAADGPKPDEVDKMVHKTVLQYAVQQGKAENLEELARWTLVRASFVSSEHGEIRCYAFSGTTKWKREFPSSLLGTAFKEIGQMFVANINEGEQLGQSMVMSIFEALYETYKKDLQTLAKSIALEDRTSSEELVLQKRKDLTTLDYGEFYDIVIEMCNRCDRTIIKAVKSILKLPEAQNLCQEILCSVTCGAKNKQFRPNEKNLSHQISDPKMCELVVKVSQKRLETLKKDLENLPSSFLNELRKTLEQSHCGEDNVLPLLLSKLLSMVKVFLSTPVKFVALDGENLEGKPFCATCGRKVRFFSILPSVLRHLGATGEDKVLEKLFKELRLSNSQV